MAEKCSKKFPKPAIAAAGNRVSLPRPPWYNDDDVNKPFYYKLHVSETDTLSFAGSIINTLLPNQGYEFAYWTADATVCRVGNDTAIPAGTPLSSDQLQNKVTVKSDVTFTAHFKQISENSDDSEITTVEIIGATLSFKPGDTPRATAKRAANLYNYDILYECWQQFENNQPVAAWYSDNDSHGSLPTITAFENGKTYVYSIMLKPKDGYSFSSETVITVNGNAVTAVPATDRYLSLPDVKTITPTGQITPPATGGYCYSPSAGGSSASPKTTDPGLALYAAAALLSTAGLAWNGRRRGQ